MVVGLGREMKGDVVDIVGEVVDALDIAELVVTVILGR